MRFITRLSRLALAALLCLTVTWPAHPATNTITMNIEGSQGQLKGIAVLTVSENIVSPRDPQTGLASGKRQHLPLKITKEVGAGSPQLQQALAKNEVLKEVVLQFARNNGGKTQVYRTIRLVNAQVAAIQRRSGSGKNAAGREEIAFTYQKLEVTDSQGSKTAVDNWNTK